MSKELQWRAVMSRIAKPIERSIVVHNTLTPPSTQRRPRN